MPVGTLTCREIDRGLLFCRPWYCNRESGRHGRIPRYLSSRAHEFDAEVYLHILGLLYVGDRKWHTWRLRDRSDSPAYLISVHGWPITVFDIDSLHLHLHLQAWDRSLFPRCPLLLSTWEDRGYGMEGVPVGNSPEGKMEDAVCTALRRLLDPDSGIMKVGVYLPIVMLASFHGYVQQMPTLWSER
ncbi:hypothetical protein F4859DRAFT_133584 [Xylaria cf. heliscus]|nr:hypothetical protein F4859DRAFT_133584 [Xylaria cf. heliscus]